MSKRSKIKRSRSVTRKWNDDEVLEILNYLKSLVQNNVEIERPNAATFYACVIKHLNLSQATPQQLRCKFAYLKRLYCKAKTWQSQVGPNVNVESLHYHVQLNKICPNFKLIDEIFRTNAKVNPPCILDSEADSTSPIPWNFSFAEEKPIENLTEIQLQLENCQSANIKDVKISQDKQFNDISRFMRSAPDENDESSMRNTLIEMHKKRIMALEKKNELQERKLETEYELARKKFEFEREIKIKEIESRERIEKMRIEYEYKFKLELELQKQ